MKKLLLIAIGAAVSSTGWSITLFNSLSGGFSPLSEEVRYASGFERQVGVRFTATATGIVTSVESRISGVSAVMVYDFYSNASGNTLGSLLGSAAGSGPTADPFQITSFQAQGSPLVLSAGQSYWIKARVIPNGGFVTWFGGSISSLPMYRKTINTSTGEFEEQFLSGNAPGFRINANPVPEPATMLALASGVALLVRRKRS